MRDLLLVLIGLGIMLLCYLGIEIKRKNRYEAYKVIELVLEFVIVAIFTLILFGCYLWRE